MRAEIVYQQHFGINGNPLPDGPPPQPKVERTDLVRAITETAAQLRSKPLVGIVLVSDGMDIVELQMSLFSFLYAKPVDGGDPGE